MQLHTPALRTLAAAFALVALTVTPARAVDSPFGQVALDIVGGNPADLTFTSDQLVWNIQNYGVFQVLELSSAATYTVVLVRGNASLGVNATIPGNYATPEVNKVDGKWVVANANIQGLGRLNYDGTDFTSPDFDAGVYTEGMARFNDDDAHVALEVTPWGDFGVGRYAVLNPDLWDGTHTSSTGQGMWADSDMAYPYYMLVFDTSLTAGVIDGTSTYLGYFDEELNPELPKVDKNILNGSVVDEFSALVVRFGGEGELGNNSHWHPAAAVPEPATAALFLFGAALLARRRRD